MCFKTCFCEVVEDQCRFSNSSVQNTKQFIRILVLNLETSRSISGTCFVRNLYSCSSQPSLSSYVVPASLMGFISREIVFLKTSARAFALSKRYLRFDRSCVTSSILELEIYETKNFMETSTKQIRLQIRLSVKWKFFASILPGPVP